MPYDLFIANGLFKTETRKNGKGKNKNKLFFLVATYYSINRLFNGNWVFKLLLMQWMYPI